MINSILCRFSRSGTLLGNLHSFLLSDAFGYINVLDLLSEKERAVDHKLACQLETEEPDATKQICLLYF